jgi:hypothetical protein
MNIQRRWWASRRSHKRERWRKSSSSSHNRFLTRTLRRVTGPFFFLSLAGRDYKIRMERRHGGICSGWLWMFAGLFASVHNRAVDDDGRCCRPPRSMTTWKAPFDLGWPPGLVGTRCDVSSGDLSRDFEAREKLWLPPLSNDHVRLRWHNKIIDIRKESKYKGETGVKSD